MVSKTKEKNLTSSKNQCKTHYWFQTKIEGYEIHFQGYMRGWRWYVKKINTFKDLESNFHRFVVICEKDKDKRIWIDFNDCGFGGVAGGFESIDNEKIEQQWPNQRSNEYKRWSKDLRLAFPYWFELRSNKNVEIEGR